MQKKKNSRLVAAEIIDKWLVDRRFPDRELARIDHDNAFIMEIVNGVIRKKNILQWLEEGMIEKEVETPLLQVGDEPPGYCKFDLSLGYSCGFWGGQKGEACITSGPTVVVDGQTGSGNRVYSKQNVEYMLNKSIESIFIYSCMAR